jgi:hypothetical protein
MLETRPIHTPVHNLESIQTGREIRDQIHTPISPRPGTLVDHVKSFPYIQYEAQMRQRGWVRVSKRAGWSEAVAYRWCYNPTHAQRINERHDAVTMLLGLIFVVGVLAIVIQLFA